MDSESKYFSSEYELYYEKLKNNELSSQSLKNEVQTVSDEFNNINYYMTSWKGAASNATSAAIDTILNKFSVIKENVDCSLIPASEAITELLLCLESLKEMEEELKAKEEELRAEQSRNVSERVPCGKDERGKTKYKHNNEYDDWVRNIEILTKDIELLTKELDEQKLKCDKLIADIKKFESGIRKFSNLAGFSKQLFGLEATDSGMTGISLEEKLAYFDSLIDNYSTIYEELNELYTNMYGNGVSFSASDFEKIDMLFDAFNIYDKAGIKSEDLTKKGDNIVSLLLDVENLQTILRYCNQNDFFKKVENYINGESWEESGIASLYDRDFFAYNEKKFLEEMKKKYGVSDVRTYFKENAEAILSSVKNFNTAYEDHQSLLTLMSSVNAKREQLENAKALVPFEHEMENADFKNYLNKDYSLYNLIDRNKLKYLSKQEVALFDYLYNTKSKEEAENYLKAMDDAINQRIGSSKASEYAAWLLQDGFQATDLVGSGFEGVKDGVRGWWDGVLDLGRVGSTEEGKRSAFDYELMYKSQYIYELAEQYGITDSECSWINQFYQTGSSVGNMIVPMASSFIPVAGQVLSPTLMGLSITGNSAVEARQRGATLGQAYTYGALSGLSESATEVMLGGIPGISKLNNLHLGNKAANTVANFFANAASEGLEEYTQTYLDAGLNKLVFGDDLPDLATLHKEGVEAFKQGAITSGVLQGVNAGGVKVLDKATSTVSSVFGSGVYDSTMPNSFARFKNDIESRLQGTEVQDAINKVASGEGVSFLEKAKINHLLNNTSAEEISSVTYNMDEKARTNLLQSDVLSTKSRENITLADAMNTIKNNPSKPIMEIEGIDVKALHEEVTADGRTLSEYLIDNAKNPETVIESVRSQGGIEASLTASKMEARLKSNINEQISYQNQIQGTVENSAARIDKYSTKMASGEKLTTFEKADLNNAVKKVSIEELSVITSNLSVEKRNTLNSDVLGKNTMRRIEASNTIQNAVNNGSVPTDVLTLKRNVSRDGRNMAEYIVDTNPSAITETTINEIAKSSPNFAESLTQRIKSNAILGVMGGDIQAISPVDTSNDTASTDSSDVLGMGAMVGLTGLGLNSIGVNTTVDTSTTSNQSSVSENNSSNTTTTTTNSTTRSIDVKTDEQTTTVSENMMVNETVNHDESSDTSEQVIDSTHANQDGQVLGVDNKHINTDIISDGNTSYITFVEKDLEYTINKYMEEYNYPRKKALEIIKRMIDTYDFTLMTSSRNARQILMQYSSESLREAYESIMLMEKQVTPNMEKDISYCISKLAEKYNISEQEAISMVKGLVENQNYYSMTSYGDVRKIISKYSFSEIKNIIKKIELKNSMNYSSVHQNTNRNIKTGKILLDLFEKNCNSAAGTYGVDQGLFYKMFKFRLYGIQYSYRDAMQKVKKAIDNHSLIPKFKEIVTAEFIAVKEDIMNKYGFSSDEVSIILSCVDDQGACSYASVCNEIFTAFYGKESEFERAFGYPMFDFVKGTKVLNSKKLLLDLYIYANMEENGGRFIVSDGNGKYSLNSNLLNGKVDPLGRKLLKTDEQVYISTSLGSNETLINSFLSSKGYQYQSFSRVRFGDKISDNEMDTLIKEVKEGLQRGNLYDLGIYSTDRKVKMVSANPILYSNESTANWDEGDGHAVFVTGITDNSFVVSSWGRKYYIRFRDLINNSWTLREDTILHNNYLDYQLKTSETFDSTIDYLENSALKSIYEELLKLDDTSLNILYKALGNTKMQLRATNCIASFVAQDYNRLLNFYNFLVVNGKSDSALFDIANSIPVDVRVSIALSDNNLSDVVRDYLMEEILTGSRVGVDLDISRLQSQGIESINRVMEKLASRGEDMVLRLRGDLKDPNISKLLGSIDRRATILINGTVIDRNILLDNEITKSNSIFDENIPSEMKSNKGSSVIDGDIQTLAPVATSNDTNNADSSNALGMGAMVGLTGLGLNSMGVNTTIDTSTTSNQSSVAENNYSNTTTANSTTRSIDVKPVEQTMTVSKNVMVNETVNHNGSSDIVEQITDSTYHANQNGQMEYIDDLDVINNGAPFASQPIFNPSQYYYDARNTDVINSMRDMENAITRIMSETKCSRSDALVRISEAIRRGGSIYTTTNGVYKDILKSYPRNVITEAYNSHVSMLSVSDKMVSDIVYVIHRTAEMHNISNGEALKMTYEMCEKNSIENLTTVGNVQHIFSQYSFYDIKLTLRKIELYDLVNKNASDLALDGTYQASSNIFERVGDPKFATYGVDQGTMYNLFEFVDKRSGKRYSYNDALTLMNKNEKEHDVKPTLIKYCKQEYFEFKDYVIKKYGLSEKDASILITSIDNSGACSYAVVCNEIFKAFDGREEEFEKAFGFPMFELLDGFRVFNSKKLLFDLYFYVNMESNGGKFIISDEKGGYRLNSSLLQQKVDPLGKYILDTDEQVCLEFDDYIVNKFLLSKASINERVNGHIDSSFEIYHPIDWNDYNVYTSSLKKYYYSLVDDMQSLVDDVKKGLSTGILYRLGLYSDDVDVNMISANPDLYSDVSTNNWPEGASHAVFVTGITDDSFVVSSWGRKYYIPFNDLINKKYWELAEDSIRL